MKKILSLAFIAAALLLGCSADGFFDDPNGQIEWGKVCKVGTSCTPVSSKKTCDSAGGTLVLRSECN